MGKGARARGGRAAKAARKAERVAAAEEASTKRTLVFSGEAALAFDREHGGTPAQVGMTDEEAAAWCDARGLAYRWNEPGETLAEGFARSIGLRLH